MAIYKKRKDGKLSRNWYYSFEFNGKRYNKSTGKTSKSEALEVERKIKELVHERHQRCSEDGATDISLPHAIDIALTKPSKKSIKEGQKKRKLQIWTDFTSWAISFYPNATLLHHVTRPIAEEYITYIRENGRFNKRISQSKGASYQSVTQLSSSTLNLYHKELQWVFKLLIADAGLNYNPFAHIPKLKNAKVKRDAYTNEEITLIEQNLHKAPFCEYLFQIGTGTGMRMGNMCLLDWEDINMHKRLINCKNLKTGGKLTIPILPDLYNFLLNCNPQNKGYVSKEHAETYIRDKGTVSRTFTRFLNRIGIETKMKTEGRSRASNIKGIHAMRHTFIYRAMIAQIPINIIQCIVGHVDDDITKMYADHVIAEDAHQAMAGFSIKSYNSPKRQNVEKLSEKLANMPEEKLEQLLAFIS